MAAFLSESGREVAQAADAGVSKLEQEAFAYRRRALLQDPHAPNVEALKKAGSDYLSAGLASDKSGKGGWDYLFEKGLCELAEAIHLPEGSRRHENIRSAGTAIGRMTDAETLKTMERLSGKKYSSAEKHRFMAWSAIASQESLKTRLEKGDYSLIGPAYNRIFAGVDRRNLLDEAYVPALVGAAVLKLDLYEESPLSVDGSNENPYKENVVGQGRGHLATLAELCSRNGWLPKATRDKQPDVTAVIEQIQKESDGTKDLRRLDAIQALMYLQRSGGEALKEFNKLIGKKTS